MRRRQPAARPARPGPTAGAGVGGGAGGGEGGRPLRPAAAARHLQEAAGPGQGSEGAPQDAGDPGPAGSWGPSGGGAGKEGEGEGKEGRRPLPGPRGHPRAQSRGWRREQRRCRVSPPGSDLASPGRAGWRPLEPRRWRDFALRSERAPSRSLSAGNVSERLPGTAQYGARSFATAPEGWGPASTARRSGAAAASAAAPPPLVPRPPAAPPPHPASPRPTRSGPARPSSLPRRFAHRYCCPLLTPSRCNGQDGLRFSGPGPGDEAWEERSGPAVPKMPGCPRERSLGR